MGRDDVERLLREIRALPVIERIKLMREWTRLGLAEAKLLVEDGAAEAGRFPEVRRLGDGLGDRPGLWEAYRGVDAAAHRLDLSGRAGDPMVSSLRRLREAIESVSGPQPERPPASVAVEETGLPRPVRPAQGCPRCGAPTGFGRVCADYPSCQPKRRTR